MSLPFVISEGDTALAFSADQKRYHPFQLRAGKSVRLWKYNVKTEGAIGHYYGSKFVIRGSSLELFDPNKLDVGFEEQLASDDKDNRNLLDTASNQKFSGEDIQELKESDLAGEQLINEIISGSNTFNDKSEFSKQKYLSRKRAKHLPVISIFRPCIRHLSLMHYHLHPEKIGFLRVDTLSLLLSLANARYGCRLLVVDNFGGLVIGSVLERMGGGGTLVELFTTEVVQPRSILSSFSHLSSLHWECLSAFPLRRLAKLRESLHTDTSTQLPDSSSRDTDTTESVTEVEPQATNKDRYVTARDLLLGGGFEGIILATKHTPVPILEACLPFISPSSPLLVYCVFPELMSACSQFFHLHKSIILRNLSTSWMREYQPAEFKLHPEMMSSSCRTGYVLSGIRVKDTYDTPLQMEATPATPLQMEATPVTPLQMEATPVTPLQMEATPVTPLQMEATPVTPLQMEATPVTGEEGASYPNSKRFKLV